MLSLIWSACRCDRFVIVTLSTVGYGDISPEGVMGKIVTIPIIVAGMRPPPTPTHLNIISERLATVEEFSHVTFATRHELQFVRSIALGYEFPPTAVHITLARLRSVSGQNQQQATGGERCEVSKQWLPLSSAPGVESRLSPLIFGWHLT